MSKKSPKKKQKKAQKSQTTPPAKKARAGRPPSRFSAVRVGNIILLVILTAISAVIITGPFQRGLFFQEELMPVHVLSFGLFVLWWVAKLLRRDGSFLRTPLDASIFALVVLYFLAFSFTAVNKEAALEEFLKVANYFIIYLMVFDICRQKELFSFRPPQGSTDKKTAQAGKAGGQSSQSAISPSAPWTPRGPAGFFSGDISPGLSILLHILVISGAAVAIAGIGTATGTWDLHGAYVGRRLHSPLQYPNTAAAYFTAAYFLSLGLASLARRWYLRSFYLVPAVILAVALVFTFSRGAWVLVPPAALLFLLVLPAGTRLRVLLHLALTGAVTLLVLSPLDTAFRAGETGDAWPYLFSAAAVAAAVGILAEQFLRLNYKFKLAAAGVCALALVYLSMQFLLPRLGEPLHLEWGLDDDASHQYLEQRVGGIEGDARYTLDFQVNSTWDVPPDEEEPSYAWRVRVLGYDIEEAGTELLDHREGPTEGWEPRDLEFETEEDTVRLEVRLYNRFPGTSVTARDFVLRDDTSETSLSFLLDKVLPRAVYSRLHAIDAGESGVTARFEFYEDALKIVGDYPVLGAGGGGWDALYHGYQERGYFTTEVHSHFLQVWVETGTLGFAAFLGIWVFFILAFIRARLSQALAPVQKTALSTVFIAALALGAHSALDFNLSLGAVSIFLFALLGAGRALSLDPEQGELSLPRLPRLDISGRPAWVLVLAGGLVSLVLFIYTASLWSGDRDARAAVNQFQENRVQEAVELFERSLRRHPYRGFNYAALADIYDQLAAQQEDPEIVSQMRGRALELSRQAWELQPYSISKNLDYGARLMRTGQVEEAVNYMEKTLELHPHDRGVFKQAARAHLSAANYYRQQGKEQQAQDHLHSILDLEEKMLHYHDDLDALGFYLGEAAYQLEDKKRALGFFEKVGSGEDEYAQALGYRMYLYRVLGYEEEAEELEEGFEEDEEAQAFYEELHQREEDDAIELPEQEEPELDE